MSFLGRSPEQVYRYALRRDGRDRSLTDGFGISIVLINDQSPVCTEFVLKYFVQLSHRTSNRVRFIFFSEMTHAEANQRLMSSAGWFSLDWITRWFRGAAAPAGFPGLRPDALELVADPEKTLARWLDQSAVPDNAGAAIRFAQALGVASHVPCLLIFTDVGDLNVHVMPIGQLGEDEVFEHVRYWVDQYYEDNHAALSRWRDAERQIEELYARTNERLATLRTWREATVERAREMRELATAIARLDRQHGLERDRWGEPSFDILHMVQTRGARERLVAVNRAIQTLAAFQLAEQRLLRTGEALRQAETEPAIVAALAELATLGALTPDDGEWLKGAIGRLQEERARLRSLDPEQEFRRWAANFPAQPTLSDYIDATKPWEVLNPARRPNDEYSFLIQALRRLSVAVEPDEGMRAVLESVATRVGGANPQQWWEVSSPLEGLLRSYLQRALASVPEWLRLAQDVTLDMAIKRGGSAVSEAIGHRREQQAGETSAADERILAAALAARDQALAAWAAAMPLYESHPEHWNTLRNRHIPALREHREAIERELRHALTTAAAAGPPVRQVEPDRFRQLAEVLDDYDRAVASLSHAYTRDPLVFSVPIASSLQQAANVAPTPGACPEIRARLAQAATTDADLTPTFAAGITEVEALIPGRALDHALRAVLSPVRLEQTLAGPADHRATLSRLSKWELYLLCNHLQIPGAEPFDDEGDLIQRILTAIGADPSAGTAGLSKAYDFDVFLSYRTSQRTDVEGIARALEEHGLKTWLDASQITAGVEFKPRIEHALKRCRAYALFIGPEGIGPWQGLEIRTACEAAKRGLLLVPVLLGARSRAQKLPVPLQPYSYVQVADASDRAGIEKLTLGLMAAVAAT